MVTKTVLDDPTLEADVKLRVLHELTEMIVRTIEGQALDLGWVRDGRFDISVDDYLDMATHKTAYYSGATPLAAGAIIGGGSEEQIEALRAFGLYTGLAFQIQDDLLNLIGTKEAANKDFRTDITEGKRTLVAVHALSDERHHDEIEAILSSGTDDPAQLARAVEIFQETGSIDYAHTYALDLTAKPKRPSRTLSLISTHASCSSPWQISLWSDSTSVGYKTCQQRIWVQLATLLSACLCISLRRLSDRRSNSTNDTPKGVRSWNLLQRACGEQPSRTSSPAFCSSAIQSMTPRSPTSALAPPPSRLLAPLGSTVVLPPVTPLTFPAGVPWSTPRINWAIVRSICVCPISMVPTFRPCRGRSTFWALPAVRTTAILARTPRPLCSSSKKMSACLPMAWRSRIPTLYQPPASRVEGKPSVTEAESRIGFARAANVLERFQIAVIGEDPIARSVASRMWNIATATTDSSGMMLCDSEVPTDVDLVLEIASDELPADAAPRATIALAECHNLAQRIRTANVAAQQKPARIRIELTGMTRYNGTFTASDAQTLAVCLLDGVCDALAD